MKAYVFSLGAGLLVGVIYALLNVRSPAPPAVALLGLLGMLLGEQAAPVAKRWIQSHTRQEASNPADTALSLQPAPESSEFNEERR